MSLKLDELRKRLLQQQPGGDGGAQEPSAGAANSKAFGIPPKAVQAAKAPKASEPPLVTKVPEPSIAATVSESPVEGTLASESRSVSPASKPPEAEVSDAAESVSSFDSAPEPDAPRFHSGQTDVTTTAAEVPEPASQHELADAVGKVFEQTKAFQARLEDLNRIFEPIDRMANSAVRAFGPLRGFHKQMAQLARSFEPMRAFQQQLSQLAQNFEPMKALEDQLSQLVDSFQSHIGDLIKALEPAKQMRKRIEQLGAAFDQATELQEQFTELYESFQLNPSSKRHSNGLDAQGSAVP